jgi:hypothetical protein
MTSSFSARLQIIAMEGRRVCEACIVRREIIPQTVLLRNFAALTPDDIFAMDLAWLVDHVPQDD